MGDGVALPEKFVAFRWADPVAERFGFPVSSQYTEAVLLPFLGPATTFCLRRMGAWAAAFPNGIEVDTRHLARSLGLGDSLSRNASMSKTLARLCRFDMACWVEGGLAVRTMVPPVCERDLHRLSPDLVRFHQRMLHGLVAQERARAACSSVPAAPGPEPSVGASL